MKRRAVVSEHAIKPEKPTVTPIVPLQEGQKLDELTARKEAHVARAAKPTAVEVATVAAPIYQSMALAWRDEKGDEPVEPMETAHLQSHSVILARSLIAEAERQLRGDE